MTYRWIRDPSVCKFNFVITKACCWKGCYRIVFLIRLRSFTKANEEILWPCCFLISAKLQYPNLRQPELCPYLIGGRRRCHVYFDLEKNRGSWLDILFHFTSERSENFAWREDRDYEQRSWAVDYHAEVLWAGKAATPMNVCLSSSHALFSLSLSYTEMCHFSMHSFCWQFARCSW